MNPIFQFMSKQRVFVKDAEIRNLSFGTIVPFFGFFIKTSNIKIEQFKTIAKGQHEAPYKNILGRSLVVRYIIFFQIYSPHVIDRLKRTRRIFKNRILSVGSKNGDAAIDR